MVLLRSIATIGGLTMVSRVFGFLRDMAIAAVLGAGPVADAFFVAFKFPNLFRRLFAEGAFTAAFVPLYADRLVGDGKDAAQAFAEEAFSVLLTALLLMVTAMQIIMPVAMLVMAPGFTEQPEKFDLAVDLARLTFPYLLFISLVSLFGGVLNALGRFAAAAAAPILLNLCMIAAIFGLAPYTETPAHAVAFGVAAAGVCQFLWLLIACGRQGIWLRLRWPRLTPSVRSLMLRALPVAIGAGIYQVNLLIDTIVASLLPSGSISYLFYADRINQLPIGVVGVAVGTALLPLLAKQVRLGNLEAAMHSQNRAIEFAFLLTLPAAIALMVIASPLVSVLFQRGAFGADETAATAAALAAFATGLPAYVLNKALTPGYFARHDTITPVKIAALCAAANLALNVALMGPFLHVGIAIATSLSAWINTGLLAGGLYRRGHLVLDQRLKRRVPRTLAASLVMGGVLYWLMSAPLAHWFAAGAGQGMMALGLLVAAGAGVFALMAQGLGAAGLRDLKGLMGRQDTA